MAPWKTKSGRLITLKRRWQALEKIKNDALIVLNKINAPIEVILLVKKRIKKLNQKRNNLFFLKKQSHRCGIFIYLTFNSAT